MEITYKFIPKLNKTKAADISSFLTNTGFIFEMESADLLKNLGYKIEVSTYFLDLDEGKKREIDIIAKKEINGITLTLIIECKQSLLDDWVFICSDTNPKKYWYSIKHLPHIEFDILKEKKIFDRLHFYNKRVPLAQNYLAYRKIKDKKEDALAIDECLHKLPKATFAYAANKVDSSKLNLLYPIALFSGQIFTASYRKKLVVKKVDFLQYPVTFDSEAYEEKKEEKSEKISRDPFSGAYSFGLNSKDFEYDLKKREINRIIETRKKLTDIFQIDFISFSGIKKYLKRIESEIQKIPISHWSN